MYSDKTEAVRIAQGTVSAACIDAVSLAAAGMTGVRRVFEGEDGFFKLYAPGEKDASWLSFDLDSALLGSESTCFKLYPSCSVTLALTDACLRLRERSAGWLSADELPRVRLRVSSTMNRVCGHAFDPGSTPSINAMFSVQYVAANALLRGRSSLQEFSRDAVMDSRVFDFAQSIEVICMPDYSPFDSCEVELSKGGEVLDMVAAHHGRGWPQNPASASELVRKFQANVEFAELDWLRKRSDQMVDCILNLGSRKQGPMETSLLLQPTAHQTSISLA
jgi:2-methylcitrate dehydratase PrpD